MRSVRSRHCTAAVLLQGVLAPRVLLCGVLVWGTLAGCAVQVTEPPGADSYVAEFVNRQTRAAVRLEQQGHLHQALVHWQTAAEFATVNPRIRENISRLRRIIADRTGKHLAAGKRHLAAGQLEQARSAYLRVLALQPNQETALQQLRRLESRRANEQQTAKSETENESRMLLQTGMTGSVLAQFQALADAGDYTAFMRQAEKYPTAEKHPQFKVLKSGVLIGLARQAEGREQTEQAIAYLQRAASLSEAPAQVLAEEQKLKRKLSDQWLAEGVQLIVRDPQLAVEKLQRAVDYNPQNVLAQKQLQRAQKLQANLQKLRARSATN